MPVSTFTAAVHITPTVIKTFIEHSKNKASSHKDGSPDANDNAKADDLLFDEAFHIVKSFIELGTENTVESLQKFTNTHVPAPWWAAVSAVTIPHSSCNAAADCLKDWFGPEDLETIVGGERWWQVRGLDGVDGEWITQKDYLDETPVDSSRKLSENDANILRMDNLKTVMFYVHGGGYFVNTHRYQIIRYARKCKGRAFAVNYRKAPQYPWPCALQDVIAAYLYLINPPPSALHKAIEPKNIIFAGDSAGGGLCVAVLCVLRDMGIALPAGAVLISPWVDLTHSFPSVMDNVETDIIPQHGFLAKPSTLWPMSPVPDKDHGKTANGTGTGRAVPSETFQPPTPGHADNLYDAALRDTGTKNDVDTVDLTEPRPPKVLMKDPTAQPLELRAQIQIYATTEQLTHPLVSPVLQSSLANLPPLYILAGNDEVLRDEIIYIAHKAAHPKDYPTRTGVLRDGRRQQENADKFTRPTNVHLQVFDGMCHVLTVFTFTESAKLAYNSIADFCIHVTTHSQDYLENHPFPPPRRPTSMVSEDAPERKSKFSIRKRKSTKFVDEHTKEKIHSNGQPDSSKRPDCPNVEHAERNMRGMIRERVDIHGSVRPMEPREEIPSLSLPACQIGLIKEAPAVRWLQGQEEWDMRFKHAASRAVEKRRKIETKANTLLAHAKEQGLHVASEAEIAKGHLEAGDLHPPSGSKRRSDGVIQQDRRWGPLDLDGENPPRSAIAKRRDTPEALALLRKTIYFTAPSTHQTVPRLKVMDAVRAAFDPQDDPMRAPKQSEQQIRTHIVPMHGLRLWDAIINYFMRKSSSQAESDKYATSFKHVVNSSASSSTES